MDDILIYSASQAEHEQHLRQVFQCMEEEQLFVKFTKCEFFQKEVTFCGHLVGRLGMRIAPDKAEAMRSRPRIRNVRDVQAYLGSCLWFSDFIPDFAAIAHPLSQLTRKGAPWVWGPDQEEAISMLIHLITNAPVLKFFDSSLETVVYTDASDYAIGGWIGQVHPDGIHPCVFWSRKMTGAEFNYTVHEKELLALVEMLDRHAHLLRSVKFTAFTDHRSLEYLNTQPHLNRRQARWVIQLQDFDFKIKYHPGNLNNVADFLSRNPDVMPQCSTCKNKVNVSPVSLEPIHNNEFNSRVRHGYAADPFITKLQKWGDDPQLISTSADQKLFHKYSFSNGLWYHKSKVYIPPGPIRNELLSQYHDLPSAGHQGIDRTFEKIHRFAYWPGLRADVHKYVQSCDICQRYKESNSKPCGLMHPLAIPSERAKTIHVDHATPLPITTNGHDALMIVVDKTTKEVALIPGRKSDGTAEIADDLITKWILKGGHGTPTTIITDRDSRWCAQLWQDICTALKIEHSAMTARHQQGNGQAEIMVRIVKRILSKLSNYAQSDWHLYIPYVEFAINNSICSSTGFTPFELAYGQSPVLFPSHSPLLQYDSSAYDFVEDIRLKLEMATKNNALAQERQKLAYDRHHKLGTPFEVGDSVMLLAEGIKWPTDVQRPKIAIQKWLGPFPVLKKLERDTYKLDLGVALSKIHDEFHVGVLTPYIYRDSSFTSSAKDIPPPVLLKRTDSSLQVERVNDHRYRKQQLQVLVKWHDQPLHHSSWVPYSDSDPSWKASERKLVQEYVANPRPTRSSLVPKQALPPRYITAPLPPISTQNDPVMPGCPVPSVPISPSSIPKPPATLKLKVKLREPSKPNQSAIQAKGGVTEVRKSSRLAARSNSPSKSRAGSRDSLP
jgi:hypothetical protein